MDQVTLNSEPLCADGNSNSLCICLASNEVAYLQYSNIKNVSYLCLDVVFTTNSMQMSPTSGEIVVGSVDGRILLAEITKNSSDQAILNRRICFKAHKYEGTPKKILYPITSIGYVDFETHGWPLIYSTAADGMLKVWDMDTKENIFDQSFFATKGSISSAAFHRSNYCIVGYGYTWSLGVWGLQKEEAIRHPISLSIIQLTKL